MNSETENSVMKYHQGRDFMFCCVCGTLLKLDSAKQGLCSICKKKGGRIKDLMGNVITYNVTSEEIKRELGLTKISEEKVELSKIKRKCEKCGHDEASYYTRQMRSADEGQTTFYTCVKCLHQFQDN